MPHGLCSSAIMIILMIIMILIIIQLATRPSSAIDPTCFCSDHRHERSTFWPRVLFSIFLTMIFPSLSIIFSLGFPSFFPLFYIIMLFIYIWSYNLSSCIFYYCPSLWVLIVFPRQFPIIFLHYFFIFSVKYILFYSHFCSFSIDGAFKCTSMISIYVHHK